MAENFITPWNEWFEFCRYISRQNRFILNEKWQKYSNKILLIAEKRHRIMKKDYLLYRARIGHDTVRRGVISEPESIAPLSKEKIGAPPFEKSIEGRINPKGISCLYLSDNRDTAIAEVRPWLDEYISVGVFRLKKDLKLVDVSNAESIFQLTLAYGEKKELSSEDEEGLSWSHINFAFSKPVSQSDVAGDYFPTQYLAECFKNAGYNGIVYTSSLTEKGNNVAIFNPDNAEPMEGYLMRINKIKYEHRRYKDRILYKKY